MRKTLTLLVATTALTAALAAPSLGTIRAVDDGGRTASVPRAAAPADVRAPLLLADADEDDDDRGHREGTRRGDDDDDRGYREDSRRGDDGDDECEEEDDDDDCGGRGVRDPAPAGNAAPPKNGLFGTGAPPKVQVN